MVLELFLATNCCRNFLSFRRRQGLSKRTFDDLLDVDSSYMSQPRGCLNTSNYDNSIVDFIQKEILRETIKETG